MTLEEARELLDLGQHATRKELHNAYRRAAQRWHPDRASSPQAEAEYRDRMQQVNLAYQTIRQFIEDYRFVLAEKTTPEDSMHSWYNRFATGVWSPPPDVDPGEEKE